MARFRLMPLDNARHVPTAKTPDSAFANLETTTLAPYQSTKMQKNPMTRRS